MTPSSAADTRRRRTFSALGSNMQERLSRLLRRMRLEGRESGRALNESENESESAPRHNLQRQASAPPELSRSPSPATPQEDMRRSLAPAEAMSSQVSPNENPSSQLSAPQVDKGKQKSYAETVKGVKETFPFSPSPNKSTASLSTSPIQAFRDPGPSSESRSARKGVAQGENEGDRASEAQSSLQRSNSYRELIDSIKVMDHSAPTTGTDFVSPAKYQTYMEDSDVLRAISSVTEAVVIHSGGRIKFAAIPPNLHQSLNNPFPAQTWVGRVQADMLFPFTQDCHTTLWALQYYGPNDNDPSQPQYYFSLYDSLPTEGPMNHSRHFYTIRDTILDAGWGGADRTSAQSLISEDRLYHRIASIQENDWACGMHTVFNAWAVALGLKTARVDESGHSGVPSNQYHHFIRDGLPIIRLATRGWISHQVIKRFFDHYGFIQPNQSIGRGRRFLQTVAFHNGAALAEHVNRVRINEELAALRTQRRINIPSLEEIVRTLTQDTDLAAGHSFHLNGWRGEALYDAWQARSQGAQIAEGQHADDAQYEQALRASLSPTYQGDTSTMSEEHVGEDLEEVQYQQAIRESLRAADQLDASRSQEEGGSPGQGTSDRDDR